MKNRKDIAGQSGKTLYKGCSQIRAVGNRPMHFLYLMHELGDWLEEKKSITTYDVSVSKHLILTKIL